MNGKKIRSLAVGLGVVLLAAIICGMGWLSLSQQHALLPLTQDARRISGVTLQTETASGPVSLPAKLNNLPPRTAVTLHAEIGVSQRESLLIKAVFAPMKVYLDDVLVLQCGQEGSYPAFLNDPPTMLTVIAIPERDTAQALRIEYHSPTQRSVLSLPAIYQGSEGALLVKLLQDNGFSLLFSIVLMVLGAALVLISVAFVRGMPGGDSFLWLGLFALSAGMWVFGECDLTTLLLPYPALLYGMAYLGLFLIAIPFLRFGLIILNPKNRLFLTVLLRVHYASVAVAAALQLAGIVDFSRSLYWFHFIVPLAFVVFAADLLWEFFRHKNPAAKRFAPAVVLLASSTVLELLNYWLHLTDTFTVVFQFGLLAFILSLAIVSGYYVRQSMQGAAEKLRLEYEVSVMGRQLDLQRGQYERLMQNAEAVKAMRHDMRHHFAVIGRLVEEDSTASIKAYTGKLQENLTATLEKTYCKNQTVNAVAAHYLRLAESEGIAVEVRLEAPEDTGNVPAMDLCVIMGNYLENALEACRRMKEGSRFIRVRSRIAGDTLSIVVTNSFDGLWHEKNGVYFSRKEQDGAPAREGIGIPSVAAVCKKHRGLALYEVAGDVWKSSALVHMEDGGI